MISPVHWLLLLFNILRHNVIFSLSTSFALVTSLGFFFSDIDDCVNHKCTNGASCKDGINSYTCNCSVGFTGEYCETGM